MVAGSLRLGKFCQENQGSWGNASLWLEKLFVGINHSLRTRLQEGRRSFRQATFSFEMVVLDNAFDLSSRHGSV